MKLRFDVAKGTLIRYKVEKGSAGMEIWKYGLYEGFSEIDGNVHLVQTGIIRGQIFEDEEVEDVAVIKTMEEYEVV